MATSLWDLGYKFIVKACSEPHHVDFFLSLGPQNRGLPFPTRWRPLSSVNVFVNLREVEWVLSCSIPHSSIHQAKLLDDLCDHKLVAIPNWGTTLQRKRRAKGARGRACEPNSKHRWELTSLNEVKNSPGRGEVTGVAHGTRWWAVFTKWGISPKCHEEWWKKQALKSLNLQINGISVVKCG